MFSWFLVLNEELNQYYLSATKSLEDQTSFGGSYKLSRVEYDGFSGFEVTGKGGKLVFAYNKTLEGVQFNSIPYKGDVILLQRQASLLRAQFENDGLPKLVNQTYFEEFCNK